MVVKVSSPTLVGTVTATAVAAMGLLAQHGIDVPGRISIIGSDDSEAAALARVGLTSVAQQPALLARLAVERLIARVEGRRIEPIGTLSGGQGSVWPLPERSTSAPGC